MDPGSNRNKTGQGKYTSEDVFNTLAQNGTDYDKQSAIILTGNGSDLSNNKAIKGRAKRKLITQKMVLSLMDVAKDKGDYQRKKSYWNTFHCQNLVHSANGKLYGKYCKNRYCTLCCSIRKADIINRYLPVIQTWPKPHMVTLTVKAVSASQLNPVIRSMLYGFEKITGKFRKRHQRGKGVKLQGIKSLECNFNSQKRTYNPHFHIIVPDLRTANTLVDEWLKCSNKRWTGRQAQNITKVYNNQKALIELIKYGSKIFTEADINNKERSKGARKIYAAALYNIFVAMEGLRIFERFGFNLPKRNFNKVGSFITKEFDGWAYNLKYCDWVNIKNAQVLSGYIPPAELIDLLQNNVDAILK
jgi:hypothetical protein